MRRLPRASQPRGIGDRSVDGECIATRMCGGHAHLRARQQAAPHGGAEASSFRLHVDGAIAIAWPRGVNRPSVD